MKYKIKYDDDAEILTIIVKEKGKLSHAQEVADIILHVEHERRTTILGNS